MLVLAHYARVRHMPEVESVADFLAERITGHLTKTTSWEFGHGLAGIGWAVEYLTQNGYMKGCGADLTRELDERIMAVDLRRLTDNSLEKGFTGLFHYVLAHVQGAALHGGSVFDRLYLNDWRQQLQVRQERQLQAGAWKEMSCRLDAALQGHSVYRLRLVPFIKPMKRAPMRRLGLHEGLAGYMELQLQKQGGRA